MTTEEILEEIRAKAAALEMSLAESKDDDTSDDEDEDDAGDDEKDVKNKEDKIVDADDDNSDEEDDEEDDEDEKNESFSVDQIFDGEELSEEFKNKVSTLIEAVVASRVTKERKQLEEEFELATTELVQKTLTESDELKEGLVEKPTPPLPEATATMFFTPGSNCTPRCTAWATTLVLRFTRTACTPGTLRAAASRRSRKAGSWLLAGYPSSTSKATAAPSICRLRSARVLTKSWPVSGSSTVLRAAMRPCSVIAIPISPVGSGESIEAPRPH